MQRTITALCLAIAFALSSTLAIAGAQEQTQTLQSLLAEARDAQSRGDFAASAVLYRKAIQLDPSVAQLWANLGLMYHESGELDEAIQSFREAIRLNPSLFVPQLFLGIEYLGSNNPEAALPFLEKAEKLKPDDVQAAINLGKAYSLLDRSDHAIDMYSRAARLAPKDGNVLLSLGIAYLQRVEWDARLMTSTYSHSPYISLRTAETLADEGKLAQAEDAYKSAIQSNLPPPCTHAEFGITLLREKNVTEANQQFELEMKSGTYCGLAALGLAMIQLIEGHPDVALASLTSISTANPGLIESSLPLFHDSVASDQARSLIELIRTQYGDNLASVQIGVLISKAFISEDVLPQLQSGQLAQPSGIRTPPPANSGKIHATGQYAFCIDARKAAINTVASNQLELVASCSYYSGNFQATSAVAERLNSNTATRAQGLYWESKADQKLAVDALTRAGELDADSPRMHVLLGDTFRQARNWGDAEAEYRKAVALDPRSRSARLSLAIALFTELKTDEAFAIDAGLLAEDANAPEANLLAGEILAQQNRFTEAEPYLSRCQNLKPEFVPRLHVLLGQVYAETDRIPAAISEYKAALSTDEDGSIHYRLARLYQKSGDKKAADEAFKDSSRIRRQWDNMAHIALGQTSTDLSNQK